MVSQSRNNWKLTHWFLMCCIDENSLAPKRSRVIVASLGWYLWERDPGPRNDNTTTDLNFLCSFDDYGSRLNRDMGAPWRDGSEKPRKAASPHKEMLMPVECKKPANEIRRRGPGLTVCIGQFSWSSWLAAGKPYFRPC